MHILDIDLDFFLSRIANFVDGKGRLEETAGFTPWAEAEVRNFLEANCGLNKNRPIKGAFCVQHHEVFILWRNLIFDERLEAPFDVVHVDAHADLGLGDASWTYIIGDLLHKPIHARYFPPEGGWSGLNEGNYLAFALACRWIKRLSYVHHPDCDDDVHPYYLKDFDESSEYLQLPIFDKDKLDNPNFFKEDKPRGLEPPIPFDIILGSKYQSTTTFSYAFLTQSPSYTPQASDKLIPVIMEYIDKIETS